MNLSPQNAIETLVTYATSGINVSLNEKRNLIAMGDSLIKWIEDNKREDETVPASEDDIRPEEIT